MAVMVMHRCEYDVNLSLWLSWINRLTHFCIVKPEALGTDIKTNKKSNRSAIYIEISKEV